MIKILLLILSNVVGIVFIIISIKGGKKYAAYINALNEEDFAFHDGYGAGFILMQIPVLSLKDNISVRFHREASLLYPVRFVEFYSRARWAQLLTLGSLSICFGLCISAIIPDYALLIILFSVFFAGFTAFYTINYMREKLKKRGEKCTEELPDVVSTLALLINSGMILRNAWMEVAASRDGELYGLLKYSVMEMNNGMSDSEAFAMVGEKSNSQSVRKFVSLLMQNMNKGGGDLGLFLRNQASDMLQLHRQLMLQKGEIASSKLIAPIGLIFGGVIVIVGAAAATGFIGT